MKTLRDGEVAHAVLHGHDVERDGGFESVDLVAQPGFEELWAQGAADGDGEVMAGDAAQPEIGELIAIEIELGIGRASKSIIADIGRDANNGVGSRLTEGDALAKGIFARQELAGERLAEDDRGNAASAYIGGIEGAALEQAHVEGSEIVGRDRAPGNHAANTLLERRVAGDAKDEERDGAAWGRREEWNRRERCW